MEPVRAIDTVPWLGALGGSGNIRAIAAAHSRLWLDLVGVDKLDEKAVASLGVRMCVHADGEVRLLVRAADEPAEAIRTA